MAEDIFGAFSALVFVLGLLGLFVWAIKRFGFMPGQPKFGTSSKELEILESKMIDARNRLVVARWRGADYLLAFGAEGTKKIDAKEANSNATILTSSTNEGPGNAG